MDFPWKPNWAETRRHFIDWWAQRGMVVGCWAPPPADTPHARLSQVKRDADIARFYRDPAYHAAHEHARLVSSYFGGDTLPLAETDIGPGSLALYLGSEAGFARDTVWFNPWMDTIEQPIHFDDHNAWWQTTQATLQACLAQSEGNYLVGCPDLVEGLDILASGRGSETVMLDLVERPEEVSQRLEEITQAWFAVYARIYELIRLQDGSSAFGAFRLWGPGKTAKLQCDASAMISPRMFRRFAVPTLARQCAWLDHSMYHLDGHQCLGHLDALLEIEALDAIEWTPDPTVPPGGDPAWYDLYRRILRSGKSVQAVGVTAHQVRPLLDAVGPQGMYLMVDVGSQAELESIWRVAESFRQEVL